MSWTRLNLRDLPVGPPNEATGEACSETFTLAQTYHDGPRNFARPAAEGTYDVFVSVGALDGTPRMALPLDNDDGQRRYRLGQITVK